MLPAMKSSVSTFVHTSAQPLPGITVLERGWLSSNNVLLHGANAEEGAVLVDSSHVLHAQQTVTLVRHALQGRASLRELLNTHLHSDHCGGNAALQAAFDCPLRIPPGGYQAVSAWDEEQLSYRAVGQRCQRFTPQGRLMPDEEIQVGSRRWVVLAAPGHDPDSVILFDPQNGVLISADALWENGFGVVFPELEAEPGFDDVAEVLDLIESLDARTVIPGHGPAFGDVPAALQRARRRLAGFMADPARHRHHGIKVLLKFHLMEEQQQSWQDLLSWLANTPMTTQIWQRQGRPAGSIAAWGEQIVHELAARGALQVRSGVVHNR